MRKINRPVCPNPTALPTNYKHPDNKQALIKASYEKCIYCESKVTQVYFGDVEHIKPKSKYPALKFDWSNLGFVCAKCNNEKGEKYEDATPYINPYNDNPEDFIIALGAFLKNKQGDERADLTILDIGLNRTALIERRQTALDSLNKAIDACMRTKNLRLKSLALKALEAEGNEDKEYSLCIKTCLHLHDLV